MQNPLVDRLESAATTATAMDFAPHPLVSLGEALNQFDPPQGFRVGGTEITERTVRYGFRAAGFSFLIHEGLTSEVVAMMPCAAIPNTPNWLVGMVNLHGNLVPVCDFMQVSGVVAGGETPSGMLNSVEKMILVLGKGDSVAGFIIDGYPMAVLNPQKTNRFSGIPEWLSASVTSAFMSNNEVWLEFDYESFLKKAS